MASAEQRPQLSPRDADKLTMDELMRSSFEEFGINGSPFVFPAFVRRIVAWFASLDYRIFAIIIWGLHRVWGFLGRSHSHPLAKIWADLAWQFTIKDGLRLGAAFKAMDRLPTFQNGCRELGFRNCLEATFYRGAFLDPFFAQGSWEITSTTHPHQQPQYFIPGIPSNRWYEADQFEWNKLMSDSFAAVKEEVIRLLEDPNDPFGTFHTEIVSSIPGWNSLIFYANGRRQDANCDRAPELAKVADAMTAYEEGELTMLSALNPHSFIPPHVGPINGILRCHLPLLIPPNCGLRVGGETVEWVEGKVLVFDDSFVHEVFNRSDELRIVLFFNAWHPVLSASERNALVNLRVAYNQTPAGRSWLKRNEQPRKSTITAAMKPSATT